MLNCFVPRSLSLEIWQIGVLLSQCAPLLSFRSPRVAIQGILADATSEWAAFSLRLQVTVIPQYWRRYLHAPLRFALLLESCTAIATFPNVYPSPTFVGEMETLCMCKRLAFFSRLIVIIVVQILLQSMSKVVLNVRVEESEMELLKSFCHESGRSQTDVVRSLLRSLKRKMKNS